MAITGSGTELDPYHLHNYDELKTFITDSIVSDTYGKLVDNIDCKFYGEDWEWETLSCSVSAKRYLDLDGHTIQNAYIANSNSLFSGKAFDSYIKVSNGKILNIFGASPSRFATYTNFENVSISFQFSTCQNEMFRTSEIKNCAIYCILLIADTTRFAYVNANYALKNLHLYIELLNATSSSAKLWSGSNAYSQDSLLIEGKIKIPSDGSPFIADKMLSNGSLKNSVVNLDLTDFVFDPSTSAASRALFNSGDNTTVVNWELIPHEVEKYTLSGYLKAQTSEMTVGADLRSLGFMVVNVEE